MLNKKSSLIISVILVLLFIALLSPGVSAASRFSSVIDRYTNTFYYDGIAEHEHQFNFYNGMAALVAAGRGELGGNHSGWSVEPKTIDALVRPTAVNLQRYYASTAPDARPGEFMRAIGGFSIINSHSSQSGVEMAPGASGQVNDTIAVSSGYLDHSNYVSNELGRTRVSTGIGTEDESVSSTSVDVQGTAYVYERTVVDGGGQKTGWWDLP